MFGTENDEEELEKVADSESESKAGKFLFLVLLFPVFLIGMIFYSLLRFLRLRFSVILFIVIVVQLITVGLFFILNVPEKVIETVTNYQNIGMNWPNLITPLILSSIFFGGFAGLAIVGWELREMRKNPHRLELPGTWMYNFKFRRTPLELLKKKKLISELRSGELQSPEKSPLGLNENGEYSIVSRYMSEANRHTLIVGASGSGKAVHKDTLIPTSDGMKTVNDVVVGDLILNENSQLTKVIGKYQPMTEDHYLIVFDDGTRIKVCGDHQWTVERLFNSSIESSNDNEHTRQTLSTREMFEYYKTVRQFSFAIPVITQAVEYEEQNLIIPPYTLGAWLGDTSVSENVEIREEFYKIGLMSGEGKNEVLKDIPDVYLYSSRDQRIEFLKGLLDKIGSVSSDNSVMFEMNNETVVRKVRQIVCSLGWKATKINRKVVSLVESNPVFWFTFAPTEQVFTVESKAELLTVVGSSVERPKYLVESITPISDNPEAYYCFEVDSPSHLYLITESFIATHNTITMQSLMFSDIMNGTPLILIDMKRDPEFASKIAAWTKEAGGTFNHFVNGDPEDYDIAKSSGQAFYDPLKSGSPTSKADMVLGMREYDTASAFYKANIQQLLQVLFAMLKYADKSKAPSIDWKSGGIYQLASAVTGSNIDELAAACEGTPIQLAAEEVSIASRGKTDIKQAMDELQGQMRTITASEYGRWLKLHPDREKNIDLYGMTQKPGTVIVFSLNSDAEPDFARYIGSMIMADLTATSAKRRNNQLKNQVNVYIDEFQAINPSSVAGLLEKSRASHIAMTLAQQSFEQIVASTQNNGEAYLLSILDTCSNFIIHSGTTEDSAERLSKILGKEWVEIYKASNKNKSFFLSMNWANKRHQTVQTSREERWKFEPAKFMELSSPVENNGYKSTAVVINKTSSDPIYKDMKGAVARTVWMIPSDKVLQEYYTPRHRTDDDEQERRLVTAVREDEESEVIKPKELVPPAVSSKSTDSALVVDGDPEYEDGGFGWSSVEEEVFDELTEEDFLTNVDVDAPTSIKEEPVQEVKTTRSSLESSSFMNLKNQAKSSPVQTNQVKTKNPENKNSKSGLPTRPGGLPTRPPNSKNVIPHDSPEEESLPNLNF